MAPPARPCLTSSPPKGVSKPNDQVPRCGQRIGEQRMAALPATRVCITCATATRR
ncbi:MAG: hypothetical protein GEU83_08685 [Pseudonocardiaceae bacterium]|nr:hypothetical protein [Pseudonocardiaceae bacterium]